MSPPIRVSSVIIPRFRNRYGGPRRTSCATCEPWRNLLQRTRCAYYRGGEPSPATSASRQRRAAQEGINRGHALLGGSESCMPFIR